MPHSFESSGKHVLHEAREEVHAIDGEDALLVTVKRVSPPEPYRTAVEAENAFVTDGDAVGLAREVIQERDRWGRPTGCGARRDTCHGRRARGRAPGRESHEDT